LAEVLFYHLTESRLEDTLPGLVERSLQRGWRVAVQCAGEERRDALDGLLWTWADESFTAHGTDRDKWPQEQPVFLTISNGNPNKAQVRFCVEGALCDDPQNYERLVIMFDGLDMDLLDKTRQQWKFLKEQGHMLTYWQQTSDKRWEKKA